MEVLILAAGYATRLYPLTLNRAKPLLKVGGKRIIDYIVDNVNKIDGLKRINVVCNNKFNGDFIHWAENSPSRTPIKILNDKSEKDGGKLGAIGDIRLTIDKFQIKNDLLVIGGDNLFDLDLADFVSFAKSKGAAICLYDVRDKELAAKYASVTLDKERKIVRFEEKPANPETTLISMCIYYYPGGVLPMITDYLDAGGNPDAPGFFNQWLYKKIEVYGYVFKGKWFDIGDNESLRLADRAAGLFK
ncbi:nucleotidyltransferase family protein [bacterium]|jgi:glucose-1-phosphate thymidylyltransferase|nr:nucleotidyltransferase family protein [bacterium]